MQTELGDIVLEVYPERAPITVANFLRYVDEGRLDSASFYRAVTLDNQPNDSIRIEVIQGGLRGHRDMVLPRIEHETTDVTGVRHLDGTISMARAAVGTTSSEFFICIGDQPELDYGGKRNPDGQGFAAFGRVVEGMEVVRAIQSGDAHGQMLHEPVRITAAARL
jgi:peptidyl-prolyl cis-trans isomerase A (cyclophilin A)